MAEPQFKAPEIPLFPIIRFMQRMVTGRSVRCPHCDEPVRPQATVCRSCGRTTKTAAPPEDGTA